MGKEEDLKYIKGFAKINVASICKELHIDKSNLWRGRSSVKNIEKVKKTIEEKLKELDDVDNELNQHIPRID